MRTRHFYPGAAAYDLRPPPAANAALRAIAVRDDAGRLVGATRRLRAPIHAAGDAWRAAEGDPAVGIIHGMNPGVIRGRSFLEVAAVDGRNCFHAEYLGATDVMCVDYQLWGGVEDADTEIRTDWPPELFVEAFKLEHCLRRSSVRAARVNVYDISPALLGRRFDVVRAFGLMYHLKHPVLGLQALSSVTAQALILETETFAVDGDAPDNLRKPYLPVCHWLRGAELADEDPTCFWACNDATWISWFLDMGFAEATVLYRVEGARPMLWRSTYLALKPNASVRVRDFVNFEG